MNNPWHPDDSVLIPWVDGELDGVSAGAVERHVAECPDCRKRVEEVRAVYTEYRSELLTTLPPPPRAWSALAEPPVIRNRHRFRVPVWMAAAAAAVVAVVVLRVSTGGTVSAAELLRDASAAEVRSAPPKQIRVRTRNAVFTRPASKGTASELEAMFRNANYSWEEPLSARSFARWRGGLKEKDDRVRQLQDGAYGRGRYYRITTTTPAGELAEASITIRAQDLRAVHERLTFRNEEWVEITEHIEPGAPARPLPPIQIAEDTPAPAAEREITASDELRVIAALHDISADLGDPVEVTPGSGKIVVSALAPDPDRQAQIRSALSGLPFVDLRFERPEAVRSAEPLQSPAEAATPRSSAITERLVARLGSRNTVENFTNHVLDLSEAALARAHALRSLAVRFSPEREAGLTTADRAILHKLQADHSKHLLASVRQLVEVLKPVATGEAAAEPQSGFATWQSGTEKVLEATRRVDRVVTNALAGMGTAGDPEGALKRLASAAAELHSRAAALQTTVAANGVR